MTHQDLNLDLNVEFVQAFNLIEKQNCNVFITGKAGTGKSTLLNYFRKQTKKNVAFLAPTGVAAVNIRGQTIHSFFKFKPNVTIQSISRKNFGQDKGNIYQKLDAIVIDEISMVRADLLDCIDRFLKLNGKSLSKPFGGLQVIFIGDLYQLPPVVPNEEKQIFNSHYKTPYFFSSRCFEELKMEFIELNKIYRQSDEHFIKMLNAIRNNSITDSEIQQINKRCDQSFEPASNDFYMYLTPTNNKANSINEDRLKRIKSKEHVLEGTITGDFSKEYLPTFIDLKMKVGSQVMMINNDSKGRWINGTVGKIIAIQEADKATVENFDEEEDDTSDTHKIIVELEGDKKVRITPYRWELYNFYLDNMELKSKAVGTFTQYPIILAWAVTIHKSQGKTFDKVVLDIDRGTFAHGQLYVALSRCRSLEGLVLKKEIAKKHIWMDHNVVRFVTRYQYQKSAESYSTEQKVVLIKNAIAKKLAIDIIYLKAKDEKSKRVILPKKVGEMQYNGKVYIGLQGFCLTRQEDRIFNVERILEIKEAALT